MTNPRDINEAKDPALRGSLAALKRAALRARQIAIATDTYIVIHRDGKLVHIPAEQLKRELDEREPSDDSSP